MGVKWKQDSVQAIQDAKQAKERRQGGIRLTRMIEYRCKGTYRGRPCRKLLCRASPEQQIEVRCDRCKELNVFNISAKTVENTDK